MDAPVVVAGVACGLTAMSAPALRAGWFSFENPTGETRPIGEIRATPSGLVPPQDLVPTASGGFVAVDITAHSAAHISWQQPVRTFFRRTNDDWKLVGLERLPDERTAPPGSQRDAMAGR